MDLMKRIVSHFNKKRQEAADIQAKLLQMQTTQMI